MTSTPHHPQRDEALSALIRRAATRSRPRWLRGVILAPRYLRYGIYPGRTKARPVVIRTFWGGAFEGVLPERVSSAIARYTFFDPHVSHSMMAFVRPGDVVVDIGAHFGFFTLLGSWLAGPTGRVVAIEAIPSTHAQLRRNIEMHAAHPNIVSAQLAAGNQVGSLTFKDLGLEFSSLNSAFEVRGPHGERAQSRAREVVVDMRPMDEVLRELNIPEVDFVKLDAESSEHLVLDGMTETLTKSRPLVSVEVSDETPGEAAHTALIVDRMLALGFGVYRMEGSALRSVPDGVPRGYGNFLFARPDDPRLPPEASL